MNSKKTLINVAQEIFEDDEVLTLQDATDRMNDALQAKGLARISLRNVRKFRVVPLLQELGFHESYEREKTGRNGTHIWRRNLMVSKILFSVAQEIFASDSELRIQAATDRINTALKARKLAHTSLRNITGDRLEPILKDLGFKKGSEKDKGRGGHIHVWRQSQRTSL